MMRGDLQGAQQQTDRDTGQIRGYREVDHSLSLDIAKQKPLAPNIP